MKKKGRQIKEAEIVQEVVAAPAAQKFSVDAPNVIFWLLGSILFFLFATLIVPVYLKEVNGAKGDSGSFTTLFGIVGIITYFVEPIMMVVYRPIEKKEIPNVETSSEGEALMKTIINGIVYLLLLGPMLMLSFVKPIFRTFLLMISFSLLHLPGPESALFVLIALPDILLYFINFGFPEWGFSPAQMAVKLLRIKKNPFLLNLGATFYTLYTAFVYAFWLKLGYTDAGSNSTVVDRLIVLLFSWFLANLYVRMPFFSYDIDAVGFFKNIPWSLLLFHVVILLISFLAYMWPFIFNL